MGFPCLTFRTAETLLETPAGLTPTPEPIPGRRGALDLPGLPAGAGAGASFLRSPSVWRGWVLSKLRALGRKLWGKGGSADSLLWRLLFCNLKIKLIFKN